MAKVSRPSLAEVPVAFDQVVAGTRSQAAEADNQLAALPQAVAAAEKDILDSYGLIILTLTTGVKARIYRG